MKRLCIILAIAIFAASCSKEETARPASYTFTDMADSRDIPAKYGFDGDPLVEANIREYNTDGHNIKTNLISPCGYATEYRFTAAGGAEYVTVCYRVSVPGTAYSFTRWIANVICLTPGNDKRITMSNDTVVQTTEPE